jgi:DNA-binding response OmpR family regulator
MKKKKILIIDDEEDLCYFLSKNLELISDYRIQTATKGKEGLIAAVTHEPDLILLDLTIPEITGYEILERLQENEKTSSIPVIILTSINSWRFESKMKDYYIVDYIMKPCRIEAIKSRIDLALEKNTGENRRFQNDHFKRGQHEFHQEQ